MTQPQISVVISFCGQPVLLQRCLDSLERQRFSTAWEAIVADASIDGAAEHVCRNFARVKWSHRTMGIPQSICEAMQHAQGKIIVLTDSKCIFPPQWLESVRQSHESEFRVIGGAVDSRSPYHLLDWACYFADYGPFMLPGRRKVTPLLPGNHVSYKRELLEERLELLQAGFRKVFFHEDLARAGERFLFDPQMVVQYLPAASFFGFLWDYYRAAREYAGLRTLRMSTISRCVRLVFWPSLVPLLFFRRVAAVATQKRHLFKLALSIPILVAFVSAWAAGEAAGYLWGPERELSQRSQRKLARAAGGA